MFQTLRDLATELDAKIVIEECPCHGIQAQLEGLSATGEPIIIMENTDGFFVMIGKQENDWREQYPPLPVDEQTMLKMIGAK